MFSRFFDNLGELFRVVNGILSREFFLISSAFLRWVDVRSTDEKTTFLPSRIHQTLPRSEAFHGPVLYDLSMTREEILAIVAANRQRLEDLHVRELALFGSAARDEATAESDLDFLVVFSANSFDRYMSLKELLEKLLGRRVDLVLKSALKPRLRERVLREAIRAA
jgi:uncharacterized protein